MISSQQISVNDYATEPVADSAKRSTLDITLVTAGFVICMSGLFTGASMAAGLNLNQAIIATVLGNIIIALYAGAIGVAGAREGVGTAVLSRIAFGREGSKIIGLTLAITMLGWYSVQVGFFGDTISAMFPNGNFITNPKVAAFWGGILMMITAYFGYKGISLLSKVVVPAIVITSIIGIVTAINSADGWASLAAKVPAERFGLGTGIVLVVGSFAAGASAQADITRYAKSPKAALIGTISGFLIANVFIILAGFITTLETGAGDLPSSMMALGLGIPALIVLIGGQWTTNDNNLYISSLGLSNMLKFKKSNIVLVSGVVATLIGVAGLSNYFINWLIVLGVTIPPMAGIIVADYYVVNSGKYAFKEGTKYKKWNLLAFVSWIVASLIGYFVNWGTGALNSLVIGFVLHIVLMKFVIGQDLEKFVKKTESETVSRD